MVSRLDMVTSSSIERIAAKEGEYVDSYRMASETSLLCASST